MDRETDKHDVATRRRLLQGTAALGVAAGLGSVLRAGTALAQEPAKPAELIVRAWGGNWVKSLADNVSKTFTERTGIKVTHDNTFHTEMRTKIWQAQAQRRSPPCHVTWDISDPAYESALHGACADLADLSNLGEMKDVARPKNVSGVPYVSLYTYVYALTYVPAKFPNGPPDSWKVLLDPRFKGRVAIYSSGNGIIPMAQVAAGGKAEDLPGNMEAGWKYIEQLRAQNPLLGKDEDMTKWFQQGEVDVAMNILTNAVELKNKGADIAWTVPKEGAYATTDAFWVPKGLPANEEYWAKQYVNVACSPDVNQKWCDALGLPGLTKTFQAPKAFVGDPAYPTREEDFKRLVLIPAQVKVENWDKWVLRFKSIMNI